MSLAVVAGMKKTNDHAEPKKVVCFYIYTFFLISQFNSLCNEFTSVWSMFVYHIKYKNSYKNVLLNIMKHCTNPFIIHYYLLVVAIKVLTKSNQW